MSHSSTSFELNGARLATLVGANGAGKSSLLDAIAFCLFDAARGRTDDLVQLGQSDMSARVEFSYAGARYAVTRGRTTRSGGKSFLELAIAQADGSWRPLTADSIRETQAAIAELLRVDADTFMTAVLLQQGQSMRFAEATAGARKAILGTVLGLDVYGRAEAEARTRATRLDGEIAGARAERDRLDVRLAERPEIEERLAAARTTTDALAGELTALEESRASAAERLVALAGDIAAAEAATAEVARLDGELADLRVRWQAAADRRKAAEAAIARAEWLLAGAPDVEAAVARLPECQAEVGRLVALERTDREADAEIRQRRDALTAATAAFEREAATGAAHLANARHRVEELLAGVNALAPITCPKCGNSIVVDQAGLGEALGVAKLRVRELEAAVVEEPLSVGIERSKIERLESRRRELGFDPAALAGAHRELTEVAARAARSEAIAGARDARTTSEATVGAATAEIGELDARGKDAREARDVAAAKADAQRWLDVRAELQSTVAGHDRTIASSRERITEAERAAAKIEATLEALDEVARQRETVEAGISGAEVAIGRLRRLVGAFGAGGIPARIVESVLPELGAHAQELLDELRPGMTLELRAQRAKRDGKGLVEALDLIVRDAAGERPLAMFSGGERMSVSLAIAVGLSRLIARRAGTALRTLVIDEPDGLDAEARRAFGHALRILAHHGELERVLLVSHHQDLAEVGDAVFEVVKGPAGSVVTQVA